MNRDVTIRRRIEKAMHGQGPMKVEEIATVSGLSARQVSGNIGHVVKHPDSPVSRVDKGVYEAKSKSTPAKETFTVVQSFIDGSFLLADDEGTFYYAKLAEMVKAVRIGDEVKVIE